LTEGASHLFVCFSSKDKAVALDVVEFLEAEGLKCWISARDVAPGYNYQETIVHALEAARGIVFLFSESSALSGEIRKELSIGGSIDLPLFPLRLSPISPSGALRYELATRQWIDLFPDRKKALRKLVETIRKLLDAGATADRARAQTPPAPSPADSHGRTEHAPVLMPASAELDAIRGLLARHIGPIAKVLVQKAAAEARTPAELCERLALHLSAPSDRAAFLRAARALLAIKS
jgi:hypothetical protein